MRKYILIATTFLLAGCAPDMIIQPKPTPVPIPNIKPASMNLQHVQWKVFTREELLAYLENSPNDAMFYLTDREGFRNLTMNITEMERYISDQRDINEIIVGILEKYK